MPTVTLSPDATLKDLPAIRRVRTASRSNAGISLLKRRAWFAEQGDGQTPPPNPATPPNPAGQTPPPPVSYTDDTDISQFPEALQNYIRGVREESKKRRLALEKVDADKAEAERKRLMEQGEWQKLAEQHKAEADSLRSEKARADALEGQIKAMNEARIKQIPEAMRSTVPTDYAPDKLSAWLDTNLPLLAKTQAPGLDGGKRGESGKTPPNSKDTLKKAAY
ncbi:MAG: hypothetical protein E6Q97_30510 [Desulfurellales bacterium]|nr:MAG: hypothetical protein E6Q97_30510 [Desulfurellales bacterium]